MKAFRNFGLVLALSPALSVAQVVNPPQWSSSVSFGAGGLVRGSDGNYYRALHDSTNRNPVADNHSYWELYYVRANTVLKVATTGARFNSLLRAFAMVQSATVAAPAKVVISIDSSKGQFLETYDSSFSLNAESGKRISIVGDTAPTIVITFSAKAANGFTLSEGNEFGGISNVSIVGASLTGSDGIAVTGGSCLHQSKVVVTDFDTGIFANDSSKIFCDGSSAARCATEGFGAGNRSFIRCESTSISGTATLGIYGYVASDDSTIDAYGSEALSVHQAGFYATNSSTINAAKSTAASTSNGYYADVGSVVRANLSTCEGNSVGYSVYHGAHIYAYGASFLSTSTKYNIAPNTPQSDLSTISI